VTIVAVKPAPWRRRLFIPTYQIGEAARYARVSPSTVAAWHKGGQRRPLSDKERRAALSYLQLIEVAVVAALRTSGVTLNEIRNTRDYAARQWHSEFPFAEYKFKTDGKELFLDLQQFEGRRGKDKLIQPGRGGQLAWTDVIGRLKEFEYEYERNGIVIQWYVAGRESPIVIDPRVAFGAPHVGGIPSWTIKGRFTAGERLSEIAEDFDLQEMDVRAALQFEGVDPDAQPWLH
jgi:uncharacterized protein (DUF433 family)